MGDDEQMPPDLLDDATELNAGRRRRRASDEFVAAGRETRGINLPGRIHEPRSAAAAAAGAAAPATQVRREDAGARGEGIWHVADKAARQI